MFAIIAMGIRGSCRCFRIGSGSMDKCRLELPLSRHCCFEVGVLLDDEEGDEAGLLLLPPERVLSIAEIILSNSSSPNSQAFTLKTKINASEKELHCVAYSSRYSGRPEVSFTAIENVASPNWYLMSVKTSPWSYYVR